MQDRGVLMLIPTKIEDLFKNVRIGEIFFVNLAHLQVPGASLEIHLTRDEPVDMYVTDGQYYELYSDSSEFPMNYEQLLVDLVRTVDFVISTALAHSTEYALRFHSAVDERLVRLEQVSRLLDKAHEKDTPDRISEFADELANVRRLNFTVVRRNPLTT